MYGHSLKRVFFLLILPVLSQGCVTIFKSQVQKEVTLTTEEKDPDTRITVMNDEDTGKGSLTLDLERQHASHQAVLMKEGYKKAYRAVYSDKFGGGTVVCLILDAPFFITLYPAFIELNQETQKKFWNYRDPYYLEPPKVKIPDRSSGERFLVHQSTSLDLGKDDTTYIEYEDPQAYRKGMEPEEVTYRTDSVQANNIFLNSDINDLLVEIGYQDTSKDKGIVLNDYNSVELKSEIDRFIIREFGKRGKYFTVEISVNWQLNDNYGEPLYDTSITTVSGEFSTDYKAYDFYEEDGGNYKEQYENIERAKVQRFRLATKDALEHSLIELVKEEEVTQLLQKGAKQKEEKEMAELEPIRIQKPPLPEKGNMNQQVKGVVTLKTGANSHGSGCIISKDG
ncbi:MAG: hypothetical protein ABEH38_01395, partial [Flavobacteriales bacterium]